jgi:hypothetical protein
MLSRGRQMRDPRFLKRYAWTVACTHRLSVRLDDAESDARALHLLDIILDGLCHRG